MPGGDAEPGLGLQLEASCARIEGGNDPNIPGSPLLTPSHHLESSLSKKPVFPKIFFTKLLKPIVLKAAISKQPKVSEQLIIFAIYIKSPE